MKRTQVAALATALLTGAALVAASAPASADFAPQAKDIVGVGSDTTEHAMNYVADGYTPAVGPRLAGYNQTASARIVSFNATNPLTGATHDNIVLQAGRAPSQRPNGSTEGKTALLAGTNAATGVDYARSSSSLSGTETSGGLWLFPFAKDGLKIAVSTGSNAPAAGLTLAQLQGIYTGVFTTWNQVGGTGTSTIDAKLPQSGSGTRNTFLTQLGLTEAQVTGHYTEVQEHDPAAIVGHPDVIAPFSTGRAVGVSGLVLLPGTADGGWDYVRALYNVVRAADLSADWVTQVFGPTGELCSSGAKGRIAASGFQQLASQSAGGACGVATQSAPTNLLAS